MFVDLGYAVNRRLYVRAAWLWRTPTAASARGSPSGDPFFPPGELDDEPGWLIENNRIRKVRDMQVVGGVAFSAGPVDLFATFTKYVWGHDAHNAYALRRASAGTSACPEGGAISLGRARQPRDSATLPLDGLAGLDQLVHEVPGVLRVQVVVVAAVHEQRACGSPCPLQWGCGCSK